MDARVLCILCKKFTVKYMCVYMSSICFKKMEENLFKKNYLTQNLS